jgi:DNA/RNA-binding domain of Phe-tRNA-synthetase-like protein
MSFQHAPAIWRDFPELVPGVVVARGVTDEVDVTGVVARYQAVADERLATAEVGAFPEIQAWRRAFSRMGLKPTQYRCASEALLRRYRNEGSLPRIHPLIDACNAISLAFAIPVAVFDLAGIDGGLEVRYATGDETSLSFAGEIERPGAGEVIFADVADRVHARRWSNRQTAHSAVRDTTSEVLIVTEAMHHGAGADMDRLLAALVAMLVETWSISPQAVILTPDAPRVDF